MEGERRSPSRAGIGATTIIGRGDEAAGRYECASLEGRGWAARTEPRPPEKRQTGMSVPPLCRPSPEASPRRFFAGSGGEGERGEAGLKIPATVAHGPHLLPERYRDFFQGRR